MSRKSPLFLLLLSGTLLGSGTSIAPIVEKFENLETFRIPAAVAYRVYDPFRRAAPRIKTAQTRHHTLRRTLPKLTAIMNDRAYMAGRWVRVGDRIGEYTVLEIRKGGVWLKRGGARRFLPLAQKRKSLLNIKDYRQ